MTDLGESELKKNRGGRPSKGKSGTFTFRVTASLREKLEAEAKSIDRPVSEIIEARLNRAYEYDYMMGDSELALVLRTIGTAVRRFETKTGKSFAEDDVTGELCYGVALRVLEALMKPVHEPEVAPNRLASYMRTETEQEKLEAKLEVSTHELGLLQVAHDAAMDVLNEVKASHEAERAPFQPRTIKRKIGG